MKSQMRMELLETRTNRPEGQALETNTKEEEGGTDLQEIPQDRTLLQDTCNHFSTTKLFIITLRRRYFYPHFPEDEIGSEGLNHFLGVI